MTALADRLAIDLEETFALDEPVLACANTDCESIATHRVGYVCCSDLELLCKRHAMKAQRWVNLHAKSVVTCGTHGSSKLAPEMIIIAPL